MNPSFSSSLSRLREFFLLERRQRETASETPAQRVQAHAHFEQAEQRLKAARVLVDASLVPLALEQFWLAGVALAATYLSRTSPDFELSKRSRAEIFDELSSRAKTAGHQAPAAFVRSVPYLSQAEGDPGATLPAAEAKARANDLDAASYWLTELAKQQPTADLRRTRSARLLALLATLAGVFAMYLIWKSWPVNVALHKHATASSLAYGTTADRAVNGSLWPSADFHSDLENSPFLVIDLGESYRLSNAEVWPRIDCCPEHSLPLEFQISEDGKTYTTVARRDEPFAPHGSWGVTIDKTARYVRLQTMKRNYLVLNEVFVFGRPVN